MPAGLTFVDFLIAGRLNRDFIVPLSGAPAEDIPGGNSLYTAGGLGIWARNIGIIAQIGENYPLEWLDHLHSMQMDSAGVQIRREHRDARRFFGYDPILGQQTENPVAVYSRKGFFFPKALIGYAQIPNSDNQPTLHQNLEISPPEIPSHYLDATAAHLCPLNLPTQTILSSAVKNGAIRTLTLNPAPETMKPQAWEHLPALINGLTAFHTSEEEIRSLFQGRSMDIWEMAEALANFGCDAVVIMRGAFGQYLYVRGDQSRWSIPAYPVQVVDPTGAGDAFCGGFLAGYRKTYEPLQAALYGNISASFKIQGTGAFYPLGAMDGLAQSRLEKLQERVQRI